MFAVFSFLGFANMQDFLAQPIDVIGFTILIYFGWLPIVITLIWGFAEVWKTYRQDMYSGTLKYIVLSIDVPKMTEQSPKGMENVFSTLQGAYSSLTWKETWILGKFQPRWGFEIVSIDGYIQYYIRTETRWRDVIEAGIYAQYPDAQIQEAPDYVDLVPSDYPNEEWDMWGAELQLRYPDKDFLPIRTWPLFEHSLSQELKDPLAVILEQMGRMKPGECFFYQLMVNVRDQKWTQSGLKFIRKIYGLKDEKKTGPIEGALKSILDIPSGVTEMAFGFHLGTLFGLGPSTPAPQEDIWKAFKITLQEKAQVEGVTQKISKLGMRFKIRLLYFGRKGVYDKRARTAMVKGMLQQYTHHDLNGFGLFGPQVPKDDYFWQTWTYAERQTRLTKAYKKRSFSIGASPKVLNVEELATLWHFPTITIKAPLIKKTESKRAEPPVGLPIAVEETNPTRPTRQAAQAQPPGGAPKAKPAMLTPDTVTTAEAPSLRVPAAPSMPHVEAPTAPVPARPSRSAKASPPAALPAEPVGPAVRPPVAPKRDIPDAMRILLEPGVELEDVALPPTEPQPEDKTDDAPRNLPM